METEQEQINRYFTRAVVGKPVRMNLGVATRPPNGLRWGPVGKGATKGWRLHPRTWSIPGLTRIKEVLSSRAVKLTAIGSGLVLASIYAMVGIGLIGNSSEEEKNASLTVSPREVAPVQLSSIHIEKAEFTPEMSEPTRDSSAAKPQEGPLPMFAPPGAPDAPAAAPYRLKPTPQTSTASAVQTPDKSVAPPEKAKPVSAVILDAAPDRVKSVQEPASGESKKTGKKPDAGMKLTEPATLRQAAAPVAPSGPAVTIVDIDRNGSYVLLTNPASRLPEKFVVGQKIFTGETITKIDPANGRIQLGSRTVNMN